MLNKYKEDYLNNLSSMVNKVLQRHSEGEELTKENFSLILMYMKEIKNLDKPTFMDKFYKVYMQIKTLLGNELNNVNNKEEL